METRSSPGVRFVSCKSYTIPRQVVPSSRVLLLQPLLVRRIVRLGRIHSLEQLRLRVCLSVRIRFSVHIALTLTFPLAIPIGVSAAVGPETWV